MPMPVRVVLILAVGFLLLAGAMAWAERGTAILMDLTNGAARLLCL